MEAENIGIYSALLFHCQFTGCMLVNLKFICTGWVSLLVLFRRSLVLLGSWTSLGRVSVFPVMNSEGSCLFELIILRLFILPHYCNLNIFLDYTPNLFVFGLSFQVGKDSTDRQIQHSAHLSWGILLSDMFVLLGLPGAVGWVVSPLQN